MNHKYLYIAISVSGASVLAVEILGTRILGPYFGVNLFLWSSLITVTLAALAAGYALGGRWADQGATPGRFCSLLIAAGVWLALIPGMRGCVSGAVRLLGHRQAILVASLLLFFPPLAALGAATPYALKLRARNMGEVGRAAGDLYAISTLASVFAAFLTGFWLVPSFGVSRLTIASGIILILTGVAGLPLGSRKAGEHLHAEQPHLADRSGVAP